MPQPHYPCPAWENDPGFVFLGTEKNPVTDMIYDYWLANEGTDPSATCRHGYEASEYGSQPIDIVELGSIMMDAATENRDCIFGLRRCYIASLYYMATGKRPLLQMFRALP